MDTIQIANILLTRRCNLRCDYCSIVRNYQNMPEGYPKIEYYKDHELTVNQWYEIIDRLALNNPNIFLIFYGGEPFLYDGLTDLIKYCHKKNLHYTIISNNTEEIQPRIRKLYNFVGQIKGFSASVDPELCLHLDNEDIRVHRVIKTIAGFENLRQLKKEGIAIDVVAEITVSSQNCRYLYDTVRILSEAGIYSSITTIDLKQNVFYDFSTITDRSWLVDKDAEIANQFMKIMSDESLLVHIPQMLIMLYGILPCNMKCKIYEDVHNVCVDADGSFRLCLRIRGIETPKLKLNNVIDKNGKIQSVASLSMKYDYDEFCQGCNHTCLLFSKYFVKGIVEH